MKPILLLLCLLILIPSHVMGQDPSSWQRYTVKGEEFSVTLPTLPAMITVKAFQPRLQKERRHRQLRTSLDGVLYVVDVFENPEPRQSLEGFIVEQNAKSEYDLTTERNLTIDGFAGKEYLSLSKTRPTTVQFFATDKRLFRFSAGGAALENPGVKQFFSSIMLGKKTDGIKVSDGPGNSLELETAGTFTGKQVDVKVRLLKKPEPSYTESARQAGITGTVVIKAVFSATGQVTNIRVVSGLPYGLTEKCIAAAKKIKFIPAIKDGNYVSTWMQLEYNFNLF